eukprot:s1_g1887.t1
MFQRRVARYKWLVLAPFEKHMGGVKYAEITGPHEKRYQFGPVANLCGLPFCVSIAYARTTWQGATKPYTKAKATHLVVRPHLRKEWHCPLSNTALIERREMHGIREHFIDNPDRYVGEKEDTHSVVQWAGIELVFSAADIERSPDQAYTAWQNLVSPFSPNTVELPVHSNR